MSDETTSDDTLEHDGAGPDGDAGAGTERSDRASRLVALVAGVVVGALAVAGVGLALSRDDNDGKVAADAAGSTTTVSTPASSASTTPDTTPTTPPTAVDPVAAGCRTEPPATPAAPKTYDAPPPQVIDPAKTYTATIETSCGRIVIALDAANAPVATNAFVFLANEGFYNGLTFHRVVTDFVIQGGDPAGDGSGGPGFSVAGEPPADGYPVGAIAAAKTAAEPAGTMGSQFFIVTGEQGTTLPADYARFGVVSDGLVVAQTIESLAQPDQRPVTPVYIDSITITES